MPPTLLTHALIAATLTGTIGFTSPASAQTDEARPKYSVLRHTEDWSILAGATGDTGDRWDSIKYIPLSDDGDVWLSLGGSTRVRGELWDSFGFLPSTTGDDEFLLWRALLHADLHVGDGFRAFVQGKSALATDRELPGGRRGLDVDSLALQQGFVDFNIAMTDGDTVTIRAGRQAYLFGKQRLVSPLPWANTLRAWDGVTAIITSNAWTINAFWSQFAPVQKHAFNDPDSQRQFFGVYATQSIADGDIKGLDLYALGFDNDNMVTINGTTGTEERYTFGARVWGAFGDTGLNFDLEGAYQIGEVGPGDVSAYMLGAQLSKALPDVADGFRVYGGVELGSGDDAAGGDVGTFNHLFPLGHAYFGQIDAIGRQNALDLNIGASCTALDDVTLNISAHCFWRMDDNDAVYNAGGGVLRTGAMGTDSEIGQEIDVKAVWKIDAHTAFEAGYSHFFAGDFIEQAGPSNDIDFAYIQVRYVF